VLQAPRAPRHSPRSPRSNEEEHGTEELEHIETIYSYMIFYPELMRKKGMLYWTPQVGTAFLFFSMTIVIQIALTEIAGRSILSDNIGFRTSLVTVPGEDRRFDVDPVRIVGQGVAKGVEKLDNLRSKRDNAIECCTGADCADEEKPCCAASAGRNATSAEKALEKSKHGSSESICTALPDSLHCTQPTFSFLDRWADLDTDGNGLWTFEEAQKDAANLGCRLGLAAEEVFHSVCLGIEKDVAVSAGLGRVLEPVPHEIHNHQAIQQKHFEWWTGMVAVCAVVDMSRCGHLLEVGVFDGAFGPGSRGGFKSLRTALDYCQKMLMPGGICDNVLPVTYMMFRHRVAEKCGAPRFSTGPRYINPVNKDDVMRIVDVNYENMQTFETARSKEFVIFLTFIVFLWLVNMVSEFDRIVRFTDFLLNFPVATDDDPLALKKIKRSITRKLTLSSEESEPLLSRLEDPDTPEHVAVSTNAKVAVPDNTENTTIITDISAPHRISCGFMIFVRFWLMWYLGFVGTIFLLSTYSYADLLMNAVALSFVFELPGFFYVILVSHSVKQDLEGVEPLRYKSSLMRLQGCSRAMFHRYTWGLVVIPSICIITIAWNYFYNTMPIYEALHCACLQSGSQCSYAGHFVRDWWNRYWGATHQLTTH